ncbi:ABC transporter ATP-binding protein [bacterium]|nr:ABC transporter ATP-binding protein [candidate division CSSED10-310 bacterium]
MLHIENLVKVYPGPITALQGINLIIENGMFGLLGPNGAGKTTLMRIIAGVMEPTSGSVIFNGDDVTADPSKIWSQLGYLPQEFGFYPNLTGKQMLIHLLRLKGIQHERGSSYLADQLLERVNLSSAARRKIKSYSGGMRQRLGIAQAIAGAPNLLVVDEPTAGLDPEERLRFYRILTELSQDRTVILSTHIVEDVSVLCPTIAVIRNGRLLTVTRPETARRALDGKIYQGTVSTDRLTALAETHCVTKAFLFEGRQQVRIFLADTGVPEGFEPVTPTLEDAYLVMMRESPDNDASTRRSV